MYSWYDQRARVTHKHKITKRCTLTVINNLCQLRPRAIVVGCVSVCCIILPFPLCVVCRYRTHHYSIYYPLVSPLFSVKTVFVIQDDFINHHFVLSHVKYTHTQSYCSQYYTHSLCSRRERFSIVFCTRHHMGHRLVKVNKTNAHTSMHTLAHRLPVCVRGPQYAPQPVM